MPVGPYKDHFNRDESDPSDPDSEIDMYGHCAPFCESGRSVTGTPVDDHGPYCQSWPAGSVEGAQFGPDGRRAGISISVVERYTHGMYRLGDVSGPHSRRRIEIAFFNAEGEGDAREVFVPLGEARSLAAALIHMADLGEGPTSPPGAGR